MSDGPPWAVGTNCNLTLRHTDVNGNVLETCQMNWHTHAGAGGTATGGGADPRTAESAPMSHVWAWGVDMWERGVDGTQYNSWFVLWRTLPGICSEYDSCV